MASISKEAKIVVNDFLYGKKGNGFANNFEWNFKSKYVLITSLYAQQPNVNKEILDILQEYNKNLADLGFGKEDIKILQDEYAAVIEYCCHFFENNGGAISSEYLFTEPISLTEFIVELLKGNNDIENKRIYLPFAGLANIATLLPNNEFTGSEISAKAWAFSNIRLSANNLRSDIKLGNSFSEIESDSQKYDYIVMTPPWGYEDANVATTIKKMIENNLQEKGELYAVLPKTFCVGKQWQELRSYLINNKCLEAIITLPAIFSPITEMDACLICVDKTELQNIAFINASSNFFVANNDYQNGSFSNILKYRSIMDVISSSDENYMIVEPYNMIGENVFLLPAYQLEYYNENVRKIADLVDEVTLKDVEFAERPSVATKELSSNYWNCLIEQTELPQRRCSHILETDCALAGFVGGKFKVGKINGLSSTNPIGVRQRIIPFCLKTNLLSEDFLFRCLLSEEMSRQVEMLSITELGERDFLNLHIIVPSLDEQNRLCKEDARQSFSEADKKIKSSADEFRRDIHMKKHAIGQTIFNLNNWWKVLQRARKEGNGIVDDNAIIGNTQKIAVKDIYNNLQQAIGQLQEQINRFDRGNGLVVETFALTDFIEDYIEKHSSPLFKYDYDASSHRHPHTITIYDEVMAEAGEPFEWVTFSPEALTIVFDNIISNACSHGFEGREPNQNVVKIELDMDGENYVITISNNGKPVQSDVTEEDVFTYNKSTQIGKNHYGIGGYEVKRLMQEFDGDAEFVSQPNNAYPVAYKLTFYNTNMDSL